MMKNSIAFLMLLIPLIVSAQGFSRGNPQQMQAMMQKAKEMQACMQNVDQVKMQTFQQQAMRMGKEVKALCAAGQRSEALNKAISFSREVAADSTMREIKRCSEIMKGVMPDLSTDISDYKDDSSAQHICD